MGYSVYTLTPNVDPKELVNLINSTTEKVITYEPRYFPYLEDVKTLSYASASHKKKEGVGIDYGCLSGEERILAYAIIAGLAIRYNKNKYYYDGERTVLKVSKNAPTTLISDTEINITEIYRPNGMPVFTTKHDGRSLADFPIQRTQQLIVWIK